MGWATLPGPLAIEWGQWQNSTVRVGPEGKRDALGRPNVRPHRVGRRETEAFAVVVPEGFEDEGLDDWLERAVRFVESLPVK